jgi:glycosyltransferase involved in cell wall biosynthesis
MTMALCPPALHMTPTAPARRRILLSAFACSPLWGSEPGVGWRWALELGRHHDVTVLTHAYFRDQIEPLALRGGAPGVSFEWFTVPGALGHPHHQLNSRTYYWLWQFTARKHVKALLSRTPHDVIHHLTWGTYRFPSFLGGLGTPLVIGPVGGGETAPWRLWRRWPWREQLFYGARQLSILLSRWDPFVMLSMQRAACVLTKTRETRAALPWFARAKAHEASEIGVAPLQVAPARVHDSTAPLALLYAGRLLGGKGVPYLLPMMKRLVEQGVSVRLTLAGDGRLDAWVRRRVDALGLTGFVQLAGKVPRERMQALYDASDLLVFPSWHDSSGNVVTEALARGVPVLCLDLGGPRYAVDEACARVVSTAGLNETGVAHALAAEVEKLAADREALKAMSAAALRRIGEMSWAHQVERAYTIIGTQLGWQSAAPASPAPAEGNAASEALCA